MVGGTINKKGFMKSFEAIASILLVIGIYSAINQSVVMQVYELRTNPDYMGAEAIESLSKINGLSEIVRRYDLKGLLSTLNEMLPPEVRGDIAMSMSTSVELTNAMNQTIPSQVITFTYNFPKYVEKNSIALYTLDKNYESNVKWNWYRNKVNVVNNATSAKNNLVLRIENITLEKAVSNVDNKTVVVYQGGEELNYRIETWTEHQNVINATLDVYLVNMDPYESAEIYVYYSNSSSPYVTSKNTSSTGVVYSDINIQKFSSENTTRADVYTKIINLTGLETKNVMMKYTIAYSEQSQYNTTLPSANNTSINIKLKENYVKEGSSPIVLQRPSQYYSTEKMTNVDGINTKIKIDLWYVY